MEYHAIEDCLYYIPMKKMLIQVDKNYRESFEKIISMDWFLKFKSYEEEMLKSPDKSFKYKDSYAYTIGIIPTNRCNLRCIYCYSETGQVIEQDMTYGQVDTIINMLVKNGVIHKLAGEDDIQCKLSFCGGGEPTFNKELFKYTICTFRNKCIKYNLDYSTLLITNGVMSQDMIEFVIKNVDQVNISFDSNEKIQNFQRPTANNLPSFPMVEKTINAFMQNNKHILIRSTILPKEFTQIKNIAKQIFTKYPIVDVFHVEPLYLVGRGRQLNEPSENNLLDFMYSYVESYEYIRSEFPTKKLFNSSFIYQFQNFGCGAAIGINPWIHMDGNILPCTEYLNNPEFSIGHVYDNRIEFRDKYDTLAENQNECKKCFAFYQCGGGCPRNIVKDVFGFCKDSYSGSYCNMTKSFWKLAFKKLIANQRICGMIPEAIDVSDIKGIAKACIIGIEK